jgi:hypothetical protein
MFFTWHTNLQSLLKQFVMIPTIVILVLTMAFLAKFMPETKGKTFEEIASGFRNNRREDLAKDNEKRSEMAL